VPLYRNGLALSHNNLGVLLADLGKRPEAEEQYRKALAIWGKLVAEFPAMPDHRKHVGVSHINLGLLLAGLGKRPEAEEQYRKALAVLEKLVADFPAVPDYRKHVGVSHINLGLLLAGLGKRPEAEEQFRKALAIEEKLVAEFPTVPEHRQDLANSHNNLGGLLRNLGRRPEAEEHCRKALRIQEKLTTEFPAVQRYRANLGGSYYNFAILVSNNGQPDESVEWFEKAICTLTPLYEQDRRLVVDRRILRNSHANRAMAHDRLREFTEAIKDWDKAIELSPEHEQTAARASRATSRLRAGQVAEAVAEVAELTKSQNWNSGQWYDFACVYAVACGKIADKKHEYADGAMDLLQKAVKTGWNDAAHMAKDTDLGPIREREDFKKLIEGLAKNSPAKPEAKP
jgi:tetratricopeptide (TPR) repeat protein